MHFGVHIRMNKIITTTIALAVASTASFANGGDWLELDQDIASLSSTVNTAGGVEVGGLLRNTYRDGGTTGGWAFEDTIVNMQGTLEEFSWRVSFDLASGGLVLEDAYVVWGCGEDLSVLWGQFNAPMFRSGHIDPEVMLFIDRSLIGANYAGFDNGVALMGDYNGLGYTIAALNGSDGASEDLTWFGHANYNLGNGACTCCDGALHGGDEMDGTFGVSYMDHENDGLDAVLGLEFTMTMGQFSLQAELADGNDDDLAGASGLGSAPNSIAFGYLFADNMEAAFRHEDRDNAADEARDTFGLNYYQHGHNAKWAINYIDDDASADEVIAVGLTVGASR